jgi:hypothetical protein
LATKKKAAKSKGAAKNTYKTTKKKVKVKKGNECVCTHCGSVVTVETVESFDGVYGYVTEDEIICCGEVMKEK